MEMFDGPLGVTEREQLEAIVEGCKERVEEYEQLVHSLKAQMEREGRNEKRERELWEAKRRLSDQRLTYDARKLALEKMDRGG